MTGGRPGRSRPLCASPPPARSMEPWTSGSHGDVLESIIHRAKSRDVG